MPLRREGSKPTSNMQNLDTKKLLLHDTNPRSCNDLVKTCFSLLLTSADFVIKEFYPNTTLQPNSLPLHRGGAVCSTAVYLSVVWGKSSGQCTVASCTEAWILKMNENCISASRAINYVKCLDSKIYVQVFTKDVVVVQPGEVLGRPYCSPLIYKRGL